MIILIAGASHTGKTVLAQKLLEKYKIPYLSVDHLKMGLIRSGNTSLTPEDDDKLEAYIHNHFHEIKKYANIIETRLDDSWCTKESVLEENIRNYDMCRKYGCDYLLIDGSYHVEIAL